MLTKPLTQQSSALRVKRFYAGPIIIAIIIITTTITIIVIIVTTG